MRLSLEQHSYRMMSFKYSKFPFQSGDYWTSGVQSDVKTTNSQPSQLMFWIKTRFNSTLSNRKLFKLVWHFSLHQRFKVLWRQLVQDILPLRAMLKRMLPKDTSIYPLCLQEEEEALHLFLLCDCVRPMWFMLC